MKRTFRTILSLPLLSIFSIANLCAQAQGNPPQPSPRALSESTHRVLFDSSAFSDPRTSLPRWDNGYLATAQVETFLPGTPNVHLYDRLGSPVLNAVVWFPGSERVLIYSAAPTSDGGVIVGGSASKGDGRAPTFIASVDHLGKMTAVIETDDFAPATICQAPDGTVWSFGGTGYNDRSEPNPGGTLRHFDLQKGELGSYLPRSTFPKHPSPGVLAFIRCSANEVVAYNTKTQDYIEMSYRNAAPRIYHANVPGRLRLIGFATTGTKKVYGSFSLLGAGGLYYLRLNENSSTATWLPVDGAVGLHSKSGVVTGLWGADGEELLVSRAQDHSGVEAIHWVAPQY